MGRIERKTTRRVTTTHTTYKCDLCGKKAKDEDDAKYWDTCPACGRYECTSCRIADTNKWHYVNGTDLLCCSLCVQQSKEGTFRKTIDYHRKAIRDAINRWRDSCERRASKPRTMTLADGVVVKEGTKVFIRWDGARWCSKLGKNVPSVEIRKGKTTALMGGVNTGWGRHVPLSDCYFTLETLKAAIATAAAKEKTC